MIIGQSEASTVDGFGCTQSPGQRSLIHGLPPEGQGVKPDLGQREGRLACSRTATSLTTTTSGRPRTTSRKDCPGRARPYSLLTTVTPKISAPIKEGKEQPHTTNLSQRLMIAELITPMNMSRRESRAVEIDLSSLARTSFEINRLRTCSGTWE